MRNFVTFFIIYDTLRLLLAYFLCWRYVYSWRAISCPPIYLAVCDMPRATGHNCSVLFVMLVLVLIPPRSVLYLKNTKRKRNCKWKNSYFIKTLSFIRLGWFIRTTRAPLLLSDLEKVAAGWDFVTNWNATEKQLFHCDLFLNGKLSKNHFDNTYLRFNGSISGYFVRS